MTQDQTSTPVWAEMFDSSCLIDPQQDLQETTQSIPAGSGNCLLTDENNHPVQLLTAGDLRRLVRSRLADPQPDQEPTRKTCLRAIVRQVYYRRCYSDFENQLHYYRAARTVYPDSWQDYLPKMDSWFIQADLAAALPVFRRSRTCRDPKECWGPLATGRSAGILLDSLQTAYRLCRHPEKLADAPRSKGCAYAQMGQCAAVCNGTVSFESYRAEVQRAAAVMNRGAKTVREDLRSEIQASSAALEFEKAAQLHRRDEALKALEGPGFEWLMPMEEFTAVAFETGPKVKVEDIRKRQPTLTPFILTLSGVIQLEPFWRGELETGCRAVLEHLRMGVCQKACSREAAIDRDQLAWMTQMLYRQHKPKELFMRIRAEDPEEKVIERVREFFDEAICPIDNPTPLT